MGFLSSLFKSQSTPAAWDDYWYGARGYDSAAGVRVTPETAMRSVAVYACVRRLSESIAQLPTITYQRLSAGGKTRASQHPIYRILHDQPNQWQTPFEFKELMQTHLELRGNAYAQIVSGLSGPVEQLIPIHPDRVKILRYTDNTIKYQVRRLDGTLEQWDAGEMFHLRGQSLDGVRGLSPIEVTAIVGSDLAAHDYADRYFENDARPGIIMEHPAKLTPEAHARLKNSVIENYSGKNRHKPMLLEEGIKVTQLMVSNKDAQFLELRQFNANQIASIYGVPPDMIGILDRATHSNIEEQSLRYATYSILPRAKRWEEAIQRDLMFPLFGEEDTEYFVEFLLDALNRADIVSRYTAYQLGINSSFLNPNDVCAMENRNPIKGGDTYIRPMNMVPINDDGSSAMPATTPDNSDSLDEQTGENGGGDSGDDAEGAPVGKSERLRMMTMATASRMVRKETAALGKMLEKHSGDADKFCSEVTKFYANHGRVLVESLMIPPVDAANSCYARSQLLCKDARAGHWGEISKQIKRWSTNLNSLALVELAIGVQS